MWTVTDDYDQIVRDDLSTKRGAVDVAQAILADGNEFASIHDSKSGIWFRVTEDSTSPHRVKIDQLSQSRLERDSEVEELKLDLRPADIGVADWVSEVRELQAQQADRNELWSRYTGIIGARQSVLNEFDKKLFPPRTNVEFLDREQSLWARKLLEGESERRARYQRYEMCAGCLGRKDSDTMKFYKIGRPDKPHPRDHWLCKRCQVSADLGEAIWEGHAPQDPTEDDYLAILRFGILPQNAETVMEHILGVHGGELRVLTMQALRRMNPEWFKELGWEVPLDYENMSLEQLVSYSHRDIDLEDVAVMDEDDRTLLHLQLSTELEDQKNRALEDWETELFRENPQMTEKGFNSRARSTAKQIWKGLVKKDWRSDMDSYLMRETARRVRESKVKQELLEAKEREQQMRAFVEAQSDDAELIEERRVALAVETAEQVASEMAEEAAALQADAPERRKEWARDWLERGAHIMEELEQQDKLAASDPPGVSWFVTSPEHGVVLEGVGRAQAVDMARLLVEGGAPAAFAMTDEPRNVRAQVAVTAKGEAFTTSKTSPKVWAVYDTYNMTEDLMRDQAIELSLQKIAQGATGVFISHEPTNRIFRTVPVENKIGFQVVELPNTDPEVPEDTGTVNPWVLHLEDGRTVADLSKENALKAINHLIKELNNTYVGLAHVSTGKAFLATPNPTSDLGFDLTETPEGVGTFTAPENAPIPELVPEPDPDELPAGYTLQVADQRVEAGSKENALQIVGTLMNQGYGEIGITAPTGEMFFAIEDIDSDLGFSIETEAEYKEANTPQLIEPPTIEPIELEPIVDDEVYILMLDEEPMELVGKAKTLEAIRTLIGEDISDFAIIAPDGTLYEDVDDMLLHIQ